MIFRLYKSSTWSKNLTKINVDFQLNKLSYKKSPITLYLSSEHASTKESLSELFIHRIPQSHAWDSKEHGILKDSRNSQNGFQGILMYRREKKINATSLWNIV